MHYAHVYNKGTLKSDRPLCDINLTQLSSSTRFHIVFSQRQLYSNVGGKSASHAVTNRAAVRIQSSFFRPLCRSCELGSDMHMSGSRFKAQAWHMRESVADDGRKSGRVFLADSRGSNIRTDGTQSGLHSTWSISASMVESSWTCHERGLNSNKCEPVFDRRLTSGKMSRAQQNV